MDRKQALITGVNGQDGSFLAELLLDRDYDVVGMIRRSSTDTSGRIAHLLDNPRLKVVEGDVSDPWSIIDLIRQLRDNAEVYNLAAQSHVATSFDQPQLTWAVTAGGCLNILEAVRQFNKTLRVYQASSSEMFGTNVTATPDGKGSQDEKTEFCPQSPYAIAKLAAHHAVGVYRKAYGIHASNGILFNHESLPKDSPVIVKTQDGQIDILPIEELFRNHRYEGLLDEYVGAAVWDGEEWTKIVKGTCYKDTRKPLRLIQTRDACCETTLEHEFFDEDGKEVECQKIQEGDSLKKVVLPNEKGFLESDLNFCRFLGFVVAEGSVTDRGKIRLTGCDLEVLEHYSDLITSKFGWETNIYNAGPGQFDGCKRDVWQLTINNDGDFGLWIRSLIYLKSKQKRVPKFILNCSSACKKAFFDGYYAGDGRKEGNEKYEIKGFTTNSAALCLGLIFLASFFTTQHAKTKCDYREGRRYYYTSFDCGYDSCKGRHLRRKRNEVIKKIETSSEDGWFFDIQTENGRFASGANLCQIHNSPRRGNNFVTQKICRYIGQLYDVSAFELGSDRPLVPANFPKLKLGNLDASRDWGHARDYVRAMWLMLQQKKPDDYVICTGETHTVREFLDLAFGEIGIEKWTDFVEVDPTLFRPAEVPYLRGCHVKATNAFGWSPTTSFSSLVKEMVNYACQEAGSSNCN